MTSPDEKEPAEPRLPANDNLGGLAATLAGIAAQPCEHGFGKPGEEDDAEDVSTPRH